MWRDSETGQETVDHEIHILADTGRTARERLGGVEQELLKHPPQTKHIE